MKIGSIVLGLFLLAFSSSLLAESVVIRETTGWKSYPVTVDTTAKTYTVTDTVPAGATEYYYSYPGYRCFSEKRDIFGVNALMFNASISGGTAIYCYPE